MTPEQLAAPNTEHSHQCALFCWMNQNLDKYPELKWAFAVPNGGERNVAVAGRLKAEGVKSGISDICFPFSRCGYNSLFIEMKKPGGKESANQKEFGAFVREAGSAYECCDTWEKARNVIENYMIEPFL
jgi:hypothetical protein